jgi:cystathionine gamma-synthase
LHTIDLHRLHGMSKKYGVPIIIDDTLGTPFDIDVKPFATALVTSLTKTFSGGGNVMGGSVVLNPESPLYMHMRRQLRQGENLLYGADAEVLLNNGQGFFERSRIMNKNAAMLAEFLSNHPAVAEVSYPRGAAYEAIRRPDGGYGNLVSCVLKDESQTPAFFDKLPIAKGPSLGMEISLACMFTLLAHYGERDWAAENGISENLVRFSAGTENGGELIRRVAYALPSSSPQLSL